MATVIKAKAGKPVLSKIIKSLGHENIVMLQKNLWYCSATGTPAILAASCAEIPVKLGDLIYNNYDKQTWVCTVAPEAATNMTVVKMHP